MHIGQRAVDFEIDTDALCNVIHVSTVEKLGLSHLIRRPDSRVAGIHDVRKTFGAMVVECKYKDQVYRMRLVV